MASGGTVAISAAAGPGKTSTLRMIADARPTARMLYVAYNKAIQVEAAGTQVYDVLRYTIVSDEDQYLEVYDRVLDVLRHRGLEVVLDGNRWSGPGYRGFNVRLRIGDWRFDVQFHSPASYEATKATRGYFEERRLASTSEERRNELTRLTEEVFSRVPVPPGVL